MLLNKPTENTERLPAHKDRQGEPCRGEAHSTFGETMSRRCLGCGRIETYEPDSLIVVFKKGVKAEDAVRYIGQFKMNGRQPQLGGKTEKNGIVALFVSIPLASKETLEDWVRAIEDSSQRSTPVWYASRVMTVDFEVVKRTSAI
ncbi:MAG: hypothetical protein Q8Q41_00795 [bacterium]|nr:hypothetical protein [bacterium]